MIFCMIAVAIFYVCSGPKILVALGGQSESGSQNTWYSVDDIRDMYNSERKFGQKAIDELYNEARHIKLEEDQVKYIENVLGGEYELESVDITAKLNLVNSRLEGFNASMKDGYNANVVLEYYDLLLKAISSYEEEINGPWEPMQEYSNESAKAIIEKVRNFELSREAEAVAGKYIGMDIKSPLLSGVVKTPFLINGEKTEFINVTAEREQVYAMFNGVVTSINDANKDSGEHIAITISTSNNLHMVYYVNSTDIKKGTAVEQGDAVGYTDGFGTLGVLMQLDGKNVDVLRVMGNNGAVFMQEYVMANPWAAEILKQIEFKQYPDGEAPKEEKDKDTFHATFVE